MLIYQLFNIFEFKMFEKKLSKILRRLTLYNKNYDNISSFYEGIMMVLYIVELNDNYNKKISILDTVLMVIKPRFLRDQHLIHHQLMTLSNKSIYRNISSKHLKRAMLS